MNYFKYQFQGSMGPIWSLFQGLEGAAEETAQTLDSMSRCEYGHSVEIVQSAMRGNLVGGEDFNLKNYEYACQKRDKISLSSTRDKILSIVEKEDEDDGTVGYGEYSANKLQSIEETYSELESNEAFERYLSELFEIRSIYIVEKGIDPMELLRSTLLGIPEAAREMSKITDKRLKEIIVNLCEMSEDGYLQKRLDMCAI